MAVVTVVIATHNRPDELCATLKSVFLQTIADWQVLVIGDGCNSETGARVAALREARIRYINLQQRVGEQSGPNSVGMALAETPFIALLNQDDLWLPDHLAHAIDCLRSTRADIFTGRAGFVIADPDDVQRAVVSEASPVGRRPQDAFHSRYQLFEPVSAWVVTAQAVQRNGMFRAAANIFRTPHEDWILRAWRGGVAHTDTSVITVLKNDLKWRQGRPQGKLYDQPSQPLTEWLRLFEEAGADAARRSIECDLLESSRRHLTRNVSALRGPGDFPWIAERLLTPAALEVFERTGWDAMEAVCQASGLGKGWFLRRLLRQRTGEDIPEPPDIHALLRDAGAQLRQRRLDSVE